MEVECNKYFMPEFLICLGKTVLTQMSYCSNVLIEKFFYHTNKY